MAMAMAMSMEEARADEAKVADGVMDVVALGWPVEVMDLVPRVAVVMDPVPKAQEMEGGHRNYILDNDTNCNGKHSWTRSWPCRCRPGCWEFYKVTK